MPKFVEGQIAGPPGFFYKSFPVPLAPSWNDYCRPLDDPSNEEESNDSRSDMKTRFVRGFVEWFIFFFESPKNVT